MRCEKCGQTVDGSPPAHVRILTDKPQPAQAEFVMWGTRYIYTDSGIVHPITDERHRYWIDYRLKALT